MLLDRERAAERVIRLQEIIGRFRDMTHRVCVGCDGTIPLSRLEALATNMCVECQSALEQSGGTASRHPRPWPGQEEIAASGADGMDLIALGNDDDGEV